MKRVNGFLVVLIAAIVMACANAVFAQVPDSGSANKTRQRLVTRNAEPAAAGAQVGDTASNKTVKKLTSKGTGTGTAKESGAKNLESFLLADPADSKQSGAGHPSSDVPADVQTNRHEQVSEEAAVVPYYNNFFNTYRLGPEDVISVSVFGQDRYSRAGIMIPPSGRISLALIPGGVFVNGKTVDEVAETIKKRYDEYIIDPQVSVSLDKASSYRYSVIGDVAQPGIRLMSHRMTVTEALGEAGGVLSTGDRSKVVVLRRQADGNLTPIAVNVSAIYKGKVPDTTYLVPGDQVIVPGNKLKSFQKIMNFFPILSFARIFTGGVF
jgi:protein involved in polysaccharide export with SLBB domain